MEDENVKKEETYDQNREEIFSEAIRAGKRTYFFDVKATRRDDYYLTITESKKRFNRDGQSFYEKHKIFLYKEDFDKFIEGLTSTVGYIKKNNPQGDAVPHVHSESIDSATHTATPVEAVSKDANSDEFTNVEFEDLGETSN